MTDTAFQPNGVLTRAQLSVVMRNYMEGKYEVEVKADALDSFTDTPKTEYWYYDAMVYAVSSGLLSGNSDGTLAATGNVTRAQASVIFKNFSDKYYHAACEHSFTEADCTNAAKCENCGLVNGLPKGHSVDASYSCKTGGKCSVCSAAVEKSNILHDFAAANCGNPRICKRCNLRRGEPTGDHNWWAATCTNPKMCKVCYKTEGDKLGHNGSQPTCTTAGKCKRCGVQTAPSLGHSFSDATCTKARVCKRCGTESGKPLGHNMVNNVCKRCKYTNITNSFDKVVHYITNNGGAVVRDGKVIGRGLSGKNESLNYDEYMTCGVNYMFEEKTIMLRSELVLKDGSYVCFYVYIPRVSSSYEYWAVYYDKFSNQIASAYGTVNPASVYNGMSFTVTNYSGSSSIRSSFNSYAKQLLLMAARGCDGVLNEHCDCDIKDFGFKYF